MQRVRPLVALVALALVLAGCSAGVEQPAEPSTPTGTPLPAGTDQPATGPCSFERPPTDALGNELEWPESPVTIGADRAAALGYVTAFERAYVQWTGTTERWNARTSVRNTTTVSDDEGWLIEVDAVKTTHPVDLPEGMTVTPGRIEYTASYLVGDDRVWRSRYTGNTTLSAGELRNGTLVDCV